jgi:hypothetical protein
MHTHNERCTTQEPNLEKYATALNKDKNPFCCQLILQTNVAAGRRPVGRRPVGRRPYYRPTAVGTAALVSKISGQQKELVC